MVAKFNPGEFLWLPRLIPQIIYGRNSYGATGLIIHGVPGFQKLLLKNLS